MESTPSRDTGDIILDVNLFAENLADSVSYWKAEEFAFLLFTSMAVLALQKIITKNYTRMKFIGLWTYHYLDWYLQTYTMYLFMVLKFKVQFAKILTNLLVFWNTSAFLRGGSSSTVLQIEVEFRGVDFCAGRKTGVPGEKPFEQSREPTTNSTHLWRRVQESNPGHIALTTAPSLLPACTVFLSSSSINLLAFYHECCSLIGYATHYLFCDR